MATITTKRERNSKTTGVASGMRRVFTVGNSVLLGAIGGGGIGALFSFAGAIWGCVIGIAATALSELTKLHSHRQ